MYIMTFTTLIIRCLQRRSVGRRASPKALQWRFTAEGVLPSRFKSLLEPDVRGAPRYRTDYCFELMNVFRLSPNFTQAAFLMSGRDSPFARWWEPLGRNMQPNTVNRTQWKRKYVMDFVLVNCQYKGKRFPDNISVVFPSECQYT